MAPSRSQRTHHAHFCLSPSFTLRSTLVAAFDHSQGLELQLTHRIREFDGASGWNPFRTRAGLEGTEQFRSPQHFAPRSKNTRPRYDGGPLVSPARCSVIPRYPVSAWWPSMNAASPSDARSRWKWARNVNWPLKLDSTRCASCSQCSRGAGAKLPNEQMIFCRGPFGVLTDSTRR